MRSSQAVAWRVSNGPVHSGKLELGADELTLEGADADGRLARVRLTYDNLLAVRIGRNGEDRVNGAYALVLERESAPALHVSAVGSAGAVFELGDLLAELIAERAATDRRVAVVVPIRKGTRAQAEALVEAGPPFDLPTTRFERHHVFVTDREAVFVFEGEDVERSVERLARDPALWKAAASWRECAAGRPRIAKEGYGWARSDSVAANGNGRR
jgi:hypothetical protein